jgi:hypothetical protein
MSSLANAILNGDIASVSQFLRYEQNLNVLDEYGFTPLIEAAIVENVEMMALLLNHHADPNFQDANGGTALQWAVENNNIELCQLLLKHRANPNTYNFSGQPVLVMPILRNQTALRQLLVRAGADLVFAQDYINTKLLGHMFELVGTATIIDPHNQFVEVDFEGFYLEVTLGLIADSLMQFQNHFAARQLRRYSGLAQFIVEVQQRASRLIKFQQYRVDERQHDASITEMILQEPLIIPVGYEGHAITFIRYGDIWGKCDRREDSRLYDNIMFYKVTKPAALTADFVKSLMYVKQHSEFINSGLDQMLGLQPLTELKVEAQISGNCSWANVEATIPALFFLILLQMNQESQALSYYKTLALNFFQRWRDWNKERALNFCIQSYKEGDAIRKASKAEILAAILFQSCSNEKASDYPRIDEILAILLNSPYEYLLTNYVRVYYFKGHTEEGRRFYDMLKEHGYKG